MADDSERRAQFRVLSGGASAGADVEDGLVRAFLVGDEEAFGELFRLHEHRVHALVRRYASSPEEAADLVQRAFLRALEAARRGLARSRGRRPVPFRAWLYRLAVNLGKNQVRDAARWRRAPLEALDRERATSPAAEELLLREERARRLRAAVVSLPRRQREVLTLRIDAELSFSDIADALGITENNAKVHFHHAAKRLRALLAEEPES